MYSVHDRCKLDNRYFQLVEQKEPLLTLKRNIYIYKLNK